MKELKNSWVGIKQQSLTHSLSYIMEKESCIYFDYWTFWFDGIWPWTTV